MFTRKRFQIPAITGDWKTDGPRVLGVLANYILSLEEKDALSLIEKEDWTPVLTFATAGNLSVTYSTQWGELLRLPNNVGVANFRIVTSAFTHTTASGNLQVTGLTVTSASDNTSAVWDGPAVWSGVTKANYTNVVASLAQGSSTILFSASGSGQAATNLTASDLPTGGSVVLRGSIIFRMA